MLKLNNKLEKEIIVFCEANEIADKDNFFNNMVEKAFNIEKYGETPVIFKTEIPIPMANQQIVTLPVELKPTPKDKDDYDGIYD